MNSDFAWPAQIDHEHAVAVAVLRLLPGGRQQQPLPQGGRVAVAGKKEGINKDPGFDLRDYISRKRMDLVLGLGLNYPPNQ